MGLVCLITIFYSIQIGNLTWIIFLIRFVERPDKNLTFSFSTEYLFANVVRQSVTLCHFKVIKILIIFSTKHIWKEMGKNKDDRDRKSKRKKASTNFEKFLLSVRNTHLCTHLDCDIFCIASSIKVGWALPQHVFMGGIIKKWMGADDKT